MKLFSLLFLITFYFSAYAQVNKNPDYFLNSEKIDLEKFYINAKNIDSVKVVKTTKNGTIFILTKDRKFHSITVAQLLEKYGNLQSVDGSFLIKINGKMIEDYSELRIDDTFFISVKQDDLSLVKYLDKKFKALKIVNIALDQEEKKPEIRIRGNNDFLKNFK